MIWVKLAASFAAVGAAVVAWLLVADLMRSVI
jgi:hypothetical protein